MDHWNEEARKYLLKEHGINVPLIKVMENVNGVGGIRQDTERNYKNLRAALDKANRLKKYSSCHFCNPHQPWAYRQQTYWKRDFIRCAQITAENGG